MIEKLDDLFNKYSNKYSEADLSDSANELYQKYIKKREDSVLDAAAIAAGLTVEVIMHNEDPQVLDAFHKQFPAMEIDQLHSMSSEQLDGIVQGVKGKYFEELIVDKLNHGESVAGITLSEGQHAILSDSPVQPGWDIRIEDSHGHIIDYLQAKATNSLSYVKEALEKYPDINILTTSDLADKIGADMQQHVLPTDFHNDALTHHVGDVVNDMSHSFLQDFFEHFNPLLPIGIIVFQEGKRVLTGKYEIARAINNGKKRGIKSLASLGVGSTLAALDFGVVSIPASFFTRISLDRFENLDLLAQFMEKHTTAVASINNQKVIIN